MGELMGKKMLKPENAKKYEGLSNVIKVKVFNIGTGINKVPFLITEDGKVYEVKKDLFRQLFIQNSCFYQ